jgi:hypothetical protein
MSCSQSLGDRNWTKYKVSKKEHYVSDSHIYAKIVKILITVYIQILHVLQE